MQFDTQVAFYNNVYITPFVDNSYTCLDENDNVIPEACTINIHGLHFFSKRARTHAIRRPYGIFAGFLPKHYGHFLLEGLSRLWFAKKHPEIPVYWLCRNNSLLDFQEEVFKILGIGNTLYIIDQEVIVDKLFIPSPGFIIHDYFADFHEEFLSQVEPMPIESGKKIYVSRKNFGGESSLSNEEDLEDALKENGFQIYYPEEHTISEQLSFLSSAEKILSLEGSALHTLIFLKNLKSEIMIIPRPKTDINRNYLTIANKKSFLQVYLPDTDLYDAYSDVVGSYIKTRGKINIQRILHFVQLKQWSTFAVYQAAFVK